MLRKLCCLVIPFFLGTGIASAQVTLELKYPEGTKHLVHTEGMSNQKMTLAGMAIDTKSTSFGIATTTIGKRDADGLLKLEEKVESLQVELSLPGGLSLRFDSTNPGKKADIPQLEPVLDSCRSQCLPVTVELDAKNKIQSANLPEGEYEKLPESVREAFTTEVLKKGLERSLACLPDEPVKKGDRWERSTELHLGEGQVMSFRTKFEYAGTLEQDGKTLDKITGKVFEVNYSAKANPAYQITKSDFKVIDSDGTYLFDREQGAVVLRSSKVQIGGTLTMVINGMELPGEVDLTMEEKVTRQK